MRASVAIVVAIVVMQSAGFAMAQSRGPAGSAITWPQADWNPNQVGDDFVLPLPCGGAMAFRPVFTSAPRGALDANPLDDRRVVLGGADEESPVSAYIRTDYVAGPFADRELARYYLIGKYEVTNRQYAAVMAEGGACGSAADGSDLPRTDVGWYDAQEFSRRLNRWLNANASSSLPRSGRQAGFVRLPTDAEWEFAARGGLAVSDSERARPTPFPVGAIVDEYAWLGGGAKSAIGRHKPNPLLLYDMLGNVEEMVADPFRMIRAGRLHGQPGAVTLRGGSFRTSAEALRSSNRTEMRLYGENGAEVQFPFVGFRMAIGAVAITDLGSAIDLRRAWERSLQDEAGGRAEGPIARIERTMKQAGDPELQRDLREVLAAFNDAAKRRDEAAAAAAAAGAETIKQVLLHAVTVRIDTLACARQLDEWQKYADDVRSTPQQRESAMARLESEKQRFLTLFSTYHSLIETLALQYPAEAVESRVKIVQALLLYSLDKASATELEATDALVKRFRRESRVRGSSELKRAVVGDRKWLN